MENPAQCRWILEDLIHAHVPEIPVNAEPEPDLGPSPDLPHDAVEPESLLVGIVRSRVENIQRGYRDVVS